MSGFKHHLMHRIGDKAREFKEKGNSDGATGLTMVGLGMALAPIPIIGVPLMLWGGVKAYKGFKKEKESGQSGH